MMRFAFLRTDELSPGLAGGRRRVGERPAQTPLRGYAALMAAYAATTAGALAAATRRGRLPERLQLDDVLLIAVATQRLSRLVTKDRLTTVLRTPFTDYRGEGGPGEVEEAARGTGLRRAVGELLVCPFCVSQWIATALATGLLFAPRLTRFFAAVLSAVGIADMLQFAYKGTERAALD
jgi:hypothetical protein